jgi:hypothetical protein
VAARRLLELLRGEGEAPIRSSVATSLVVRTSCGCMAQSQQTEQQPASG